MGPGLKHHAVPCDDSMRVDVSVCLQVNGASTYNAWYRLSTVDRILKAHDCVTENANHWDDVLRLQRPLA